MSFETPDRRDRPRASSDCVENVKVRWMEPGDGGALSAHEARLAFRRARFDSSPLKSTSKNAKIGLHSLPDRSLSSASLVAKDEPLWQR